VAECGWLGAQDLVDLARADRCVRLCVKGTPTGFLGSAGMCSIVHPKGAAVGKGLTGGEVLW
jgi:hypothetical protein